MNAKRKKFTIRRGSVITRVYRFTRSDGRQVFTASWTVGGQRYTRQFPSYEAAHAEASLKADQLAAGRVSTMQTVGHEDGAVLQQARKLCGDVPLVAALEEWARARRLCKGAIICAAEQWAKRNDRKFKRVTISGAIKLFIGEKERAGNAGERTYRSKLAPLERKFGGETHLDTLTANQLGDYLNAFNDPVTRNDHRKRAVTLFRWAQAKGFLPYGVPLEIERTMRAKEKAAQIGIISPEVYANLLEFIRANHPQHLPALVLAGFCAIRSDELHGKQADRTRRQTWEDVHLDRKFVRVTVAKENTPQWRFVPLPDAAITWLLLCGERTGPICESHAMEKVRALAREAKFHLPKNCLRHSAISYRIAVTGNKPQVALESGNSVTEIDRRYRVPVTKTEGEAWFSTMPKTPAEIVAMPKQAAGGGA